MSEDEIGAREPRAEAQEGDQTRIQLRDSGVPTKYADFFAISGGADAVLLTFGTQFGQQGVVQIEEKVVVSPPNAKRLAMSLGAVIRRYEQQHGRIDVGEPSGAPGAAQAQTGK